MATASSSSDVDGTLSMMDVLAENEELEEEATAVLGDSDDKCCTYATGYQPRQALYACDTCSADRDTMAGICLACSYACHDGHDLFELYTKRNFRCDCGNSKFPDLTCKLIQDKTPENEKNKYNQNFKGLYCYCKRPYPDPEDDVEDEMIQCIMCEDWYHGRHLGIEELPSNYEYQEMVCQSCMKVFDFLWAYRVHSIEVTSVKAEGAGEVDVEGEGTAQAKTISPQIKQGEQISIQSLAAECKPSSVIKSEITELSESVTDSSNHESETKDKTIRSAPSESSQECTVTESSAEVQSQQKDEKEIPGETDHSSCDGKTERKETEENSPLREEQASTDQKLLGTGRDGSQTDGGEKIEDKKEANITTLCQLEELKKRDVKKTEGAVFWKRGWRSKLCTCQSCKDRYEELDVSFLICEEDTVLAYEERGKVNQSGLSQYEKGIQALSNLDRTQQVEVLQGYNDMKTELRDFLQSFAQNGKVVKREDIDQFFGEMQARKRQKTAPMQYFCR